MSSRITDTPEGDFIADMKTDWNSRDEIPTLFHNIEHMRGYLRTKHACPEAVALVPKIWHRYRRWLDHNPMWAEVFYRLDPQLESLSDP